MQSKLLPLLQPDYRRRTQVALSDGVVFHSPVRDYHGRAEVAHIASMIGNGPRDALSQTVVDASPGDRRHGRRSGAITAAQHAFTDAEHPGDPQLSVTDRVARALLRGAA